MISFKNVFKNFLDRDGKNVPVLDDISFEIKKGEFLSILGPSGCGKTTLINLLSGQEKLSKGKIEFSNNNDKKRISVIWQEDALIPWLTVQKNIEYPLLIKGIGKKERKEKAIEFIDKINLIGFEKYYPNKLSLGMKKRVALAAGLITEPTLLLMDEPFSALDVYTKQKIEDEVMSLWEEINATIVLVTHDINEALALSDGIIVLTKRPAKLKTIYNNDLPRPRVINKLFREKDFHNRVQYLWNELLNNETNEN